MPMLRTVLVFVVVLTAFTLLVVGIDRGRAGTELSCSGKIFKEDAQGNQEFKLTCK